MEPKYRLEFHSNATTQNSQIDVIRNLIESDAKRNWSEVKGVRSVNFTLGGYCVFNPSKNLQKLIIGFTFHNARTWARNPQRLKLQNWCSVNLWMSDNRMDLFVIAQSFFHFFRKPQFWISLVQKGMKKQTKRKTQKFASFHSKQTMARMGHIGGRKKKPKKSRTRTADWWTNDAVIVSCSSNVFHFCSLPFSMLQQIVDFPCLQWWLFNLLAN